MPNEKAKERVEEDAKEKIEWMLENYNLAARKLSNVRGALENLEYSLQAKTAVGGAQCGGKAPSEQEKYIDKEEDLKVKKQILDSFLTVVDGNIEGLKEKWELTLKMRYQDGLTYEQIANRVDIPVEPRTVQDYRSDAVDELARSLDWKLEITIECAREVIE